MVFDLIDKVNKYDIPTTNLCCFYFDLECACYIIGVTTTLIAIGVLNVDISSITACFPAVEVRYVLAISKVFNFNLFFMALYFLYGIKTNRVVPVKVFLLMLSTFILYYVIEIGVLLFSTYVAYSYCPSPKIFATSHFINIVVYTYFMFIVNSYLRKQYYVTTVAEKDLRII